MSRWFLSTLSPVGPFSHHSPSYHTCELNLQLSGFSSSISRLTQGRLYLYLRYLFWVSCFYPSSDIPDAKQLALITSHALLISIKLAIYFLAELSPLPEYLPVY